MASTTCFDHLPPLCVELVGRQLVGLFGAAPDRATGDRSAAAACAASLALVGDGEGRFAGLSRALYEAAVDPGCLAVARAAIEVDGAARARAESFVELLDATAALVRTEDPKPSLAALRGACRDLGVPVSGTKAALLARLSSDCPVLRASRLARLARAPLGLPACPVREPARALVRALRAGRGAKRVYGSAAMIDHGLRTEDLARLPVVRQPVPHRPNTFVRMYDIVDVLEAAAARSAGAEAARTSADAVDAVGEREGAAEMRAGKAAAALARRCVRRRAELDAILAATILATPEAAGLFDTDIVAFERALSGACWVVESNIRVFLSGSRRRYDTVTSVRDSIVRATPEAVRWRRLEVALAAVGCELTSETHVCTEYVKEGRGSLRKAMEAAWERHFLLASTDYAARVARVPECVFGNNSKTNLLREVRHCQVILQAKSDAVAAWVAAGGGEVAVLRAAASGAGTSGAAAQLPPTILKGMAQAFAVRLFEGQARVPRGLDRHCGAWTGLVTSWIAEVLRLVNPIAPVASETIADSSETARRLLALLDDPVGGAMAPKLAAMVARVAEVDRAVARVSAWVATVLRKAYDEPIRCLRNMETHVLSIASTTVETLLGFTEALVENAIHSPGFILARRCNLCSDHRLFSPQSLLQHQRDKHWKI